MQAQLFDRMGVPIPDCPPNWSGQRADRQSVNFLVQSVTALDTIEISGTWLP